MTWMNGCFGDDFSFCCSGFDHPARNPEWAGKFDLPEDRVFVGGYVRNGEETTPLVAIEKRTTHDPVTLHPTRIEMEFTDANGRRYAANGEMIAASSFSQWYNMTIPLCLMRWECDGRIGYGDAQDVQWADYVYDALGGRADP
jgi:hypothetical protein